MRRLLVVLVLVIAVVVGVGYYRDWFHFSTRGAGTDQPGIEFNINKDKVKSDAEQAKEKAGEAGDKAKEKTGELGKKTNGQTERK
jgi:hypothetical protein